MGDDPDDARRPGLLLVGRFFGVPIFFAWTWVLIAAFLTIYYGPLVRKDVPGVSDSSAYLIAFAFAVTFAACVLAHELGHTAVSLALRLPVRRIVIFLLGGISEITKEPDRPRDEFLVAAAGPAVSALLGAGMFGITLALPAHSLGRELAWLLCWGNASVAVFNLLPGLPLDGGRLIRAAVWRIGGSQLTGTRVGVVVGRGLAIALLGATVLFAGRVADPTEVSLVGGLTAYYLWAGATQSLRLARLQDRLGTVDLARLLRPGLFVPSSITVAEALDRVWAASARGLVLVDSADHPTSIVSESKIGQVPPPRRPWTPLTTVARALEPGMILPVGLAGEQLLDAIRRTPASEYLVVHPDGSPAGILATVDLASTLKGAV